MPKVVAILCRSWWSYSPVDPDLFSRIYHVFNLAEGLAWCALAALVLRRYFRHRRSHAEIAYSLAFAAFGASDFREAYALQTWLILAKFINLVCLVLLRATVIRRFYPDSKTY